jgi:tRNA A-37 threonylcarbamoyl transferase component Bud32
VPNEATVFPLFITNQENKRVMSNDREEVFKGHEKAQELLSSIDSITEELEQRLQSSLHVSSISVEHNPQNELPISPSQVHSKTSLGYRNLDHSESSSVSKSLENSDEPNQPESDTLPRENEPAPVSMSTASSSERIGPDNFIKLKLIGKGDTGKVFLVLKQNTRQVYAMKMLSKSEMVRRNKVKRVLIERDVLASSRHPFILPLHYSFQTEKHLYLITEFCSGGEFFRILQNQPGRRLREEHVKFYIAEIISALEYLHLMGYVYRDLKPENVLLHESGHIMLSDFDLSKRSFPMTKPSLVKSVLSRLSPRILTLDTRVAAEYIRSTSFVGTEEYLAPEVIKGKPHTSAVDWWTLGVLTYEFLFGITPFKGADKHSTFRHILHTDVSFPVWPKVNN